MPYDLWATEADGALTSETAEFRLVIGRYKGGRRFLVFRKSTRPGDVHSLVASGSRETVLEAMKHAISTATRLGIAQAPGIEPSLETWG